MQTDALALAGQASKAGQSERLTWGVVEIQVTDLDRAVDFWTTALGLSVREQNRDQWVALGTLSKTLFVIHAGASVAVSPRHVGLYHVAIGVPDQAEFSRLMARLLSMRVPLSPVDHLMSKAIYVHDPDGLEIEIAFETPERFGSFRDVSQGVGMYDRDGRQHSGRERLDTDAELSFADGADLVAPLSDEAFLAHVHFKVPDLESAVTWFEGIGFARNLMLPDFGFADMGAGAAYTHRLAMNIWAGPNLSPTPAHMAGMIRYSLLANDPVLIESVKGLQPSGNGFIGRDPTGIDMSLDLNSDSQMEKLQ